MYYDLTAYLTIINNRIADNSKKVLLNNFNDLDNYLNDKIKTIIISPILYNNIRTYNNFRLANKHEIMYKYIYGKWNGINVMVRSMNDKDAIYLSEKNPEDLIMGL